MGFMDNQLPQTIFELVERFEKNSYFLYRSKDRLYAFDYRRNYNDPQKNPLNK